MEFTLPHPQAFEMAPGIRIGEEPFVLIAGPCVVESEEPGVSVAERLKEMTRRSASLDFQSLV